MVYCLLVNRTQFLREHASVPHDQSVNITRALLCELLAIRVLRRYNEAHKGPESLLLLANILVAGFDCFQNAPAWICAQNDEALQRVQKRGGNERKLPALEIAIISESKIFLSCSAVQKVVRAIYEGRVVYTPTSFIDILPDHYKQKPISLYEPRGAPIFDQYRLMVPRTRNCIEIGQFLVLLTLYILVMAYRDASQTSLLEIAFMIYAAGWTLDQFASMLEHGWMVYTQNLWSFLDVTFIFIYLTYVIVRLHAMRSNSLDLGGQALDILSLGAPVLIPRLAFNLMKENMLFVSLRDMMVDFGKLTLLAVWCFTGFLLALLWLGDGRHPAVTISKWMIWVWFGLDGTGIESSAELHWLLGPVLMVLFAFLGSTLFLTLLIAMLSNTFSAIVSNASQEIQFRRAVMTLEGVKSDAIFAYIPPCNLLALGLLLPLKFVLSPRWFHKINVAAVRTLNAPLLLIIGVIERKTLWSGLGVPAFKGNERPELHRTTSRTGFWKMSRGFSVHGDISAVFDIDSDYDITEEEDNISVRDLDPQAIEETEADPALKVDGTFNDEARAHSSSPGAQRKSSDSNRPEVRGHVSGSGPSSSRGRKDSIAPYGDLKSQLRHMLNDATIDEGEEVSPADQMHSHRLKDFEDKLNKIEKLLGNLCKNFGVEQSNSVDEDAGKIGIVPLEDGDTTLTNERNE